MRNKPESGNVFLAIFGAVALVGVLGAGVMNFSNGPIQSALTLNKRNAADIDMSMAGQLAIMSASNTANKGDCDGDSYVEPPEFRDAGTSPKPVGGGLIPNTIGTAKKDPWGTEYGYCVWDAGPVTLNAGCQGTSGTDKRLQGSDSKIYPVIAIISAGPDGAFTTTCRNFSTGTTRADQNNDADIDDVGDFPLVAKAATTDDDIIVTYSYEGAMASSGGLWKLRSSDPNTAYLDKKIEAQAATIMGTGTFERIAAIGGDFVDIISGLKLADPLIMSTCNAANTSILRRALSGFGIEICSGTAWSVVGSGSGGGGGGGGPVSSLNDLGDAIVVGDNVFGGKDVGNEGLSGTGNTGFGIRNLKNITTGSNNTAFGFEAMADATSANNNTAIGWRAGYKMNTSAAEKNTAFGYEALVNCTACASNTAIGYQAAKMLSTGASNATAGNFSLLSATTGTGNAVAGYEALKSATAPSMNVAIGFNAAKFATAFNNNVSVGSQSMASPTALSRTQNVAIGTDTMKAGATITNSVAVGSLAMTNAQGSDNVAIGYLTLNAASSGTENTAVGSEALKLSTASGTTAIGYQVLQTASGAGNTAAGVQSLYSVTTGTNNTAIGYQALSSGGDITFNTAAGSGSMRSLLNGSTGNTAIGKDSMIGAGIKSFNTAIGFESLKAGTTSLRNTLMGYQTGLAITTGNDNVAIGHGSLALNVTGSNNTAVGVFAGRGITSSDVTVIGGQLNSKIDIAAGSVYAGYNNYPSDTAPALNTVIGYQAMATNATAANNVIAGASAGSSPGAANVAIGYNALKAASPANNVAIGARVLSAATASGNTAIGNSSGTTLTTGTKITLFGSSVAASTNAGSDNTLFGGGGFLTGAANTTVGAAALSAAGTKNNNVAIGTSALSGLTTGSNNVGLGAVTLTSLSTGSNNVMAKGLGTIGTSASNMTSINGGTITANLTNSTAIGYNAGITASNTIRFGNASVTNISGQVAFTATSDKRVKKDIHPTDLGLDFIMKLQPVSYRLIDGNGRLDYGFIAQDIENALEGRKTNLITRMNDKERTYKMRGDDLLSPIVRAVQEQQQALESLEKELDSMR